MSEQIGIGDVVRLKSGGPKMVIDGLQMEGEVVGGHFHIWGTDWFDAAGHLQTGSFMQCLLEQFKD